MKTQILYILAGDEPVLDYDLTPTEMDDAFEIFEGVYDSTVHA